MEALQYICTSNMDVPIGHVIYTGILNHQGGYVTDCTVTRLNKDRLAWVYVGFLCCLGGTQAIVPIKFICYLLYILVTVQTTVAYHELCRSFLSTLNFSMFINPLTGEAENSRHCKVLLQKKSLKIDRSLLTGSKHTNTRPKDCSFK